MNLKDKKPYLIYCIGDSHVSFFSGINEIQRVWPNKSQMILPFFKVFPVGQTLAYNLIKSNSSSHGREKIFTILKKEIPKGSNILFCFGEIDCRAHLIKQSRIQKRNLSSIVEECVDRYFSAILDINNLGYKVLVWNVVPSTRLNKINNNMYPLVGNCKERNLVTVMFNKYLARKCNAIRIPFVFIYQNIIDKHGLTKMFYYMDGIHLSQKAMPMTLKAISRSLKVDLKLNFYNLTKYVICNALRDTYLVAKYFKKALIKDHKWQYF